MTTRATGQKKLRPSKIIDSLIVLPYFYVVLMPNLSFMREWLKPYSTGKASSFFSTLPMIGYFLVLFLPLLSLGALILLIWRGPKWAGSKTFFAQAVKVFLIIGVCYSVPVIWFLGRFLASIFNLLLASPSFSTIAGILGASVTLAPLLIVAGKHIRRLYTELRKEKI